MRHLLFQRIIRCNRKELVANPVFGASHFGSTKLASSRSSSSRSGSIEEEMPPSCVYYTARRRLWLEEQWPADFDFEEQPKPIHNARYCVWFFSGWYVFVFLLFLFSSLFLFSFTWFFSYLSFLRVDSRHIRSWRASWSCSSSITSSLSWLSSFYRRFSQRK